MFWKSKPVQFDNRVYSALMPEAKKMIDDLRALVSEIEENQNGYDLLTDVREFEVLACKLLLSYQRRKKAVLNFKIPTIKLDIEKSYDLTSIEKEKFDAAYRERAELVKRKKENFLNLKSSLELIKLQFENIFLYLTSLNESLMVDEHYAPTNMAAKLDDARELLKIYGYSS